MGMQDVEYHKHFEKNKPGGNNTSNYERSALSQVLGRSKLSLGGSLKISEINVNKVVKSSISVRGLGDMDIKVGKDAHDEEHGGQVWDPKTEKWVSKARMENE